MHGEGQGPRKDLVGDGKISRTETIARPEVAGKGYMPGADGGLDTLVLQRADDARTRSRHLLREQAHIGLVHRITTRADVRHGQLRRNHQVVVDGAGLSPVDEDPPQLFQLAQTERRLKFGQSVVEAGGYEIGSRGGWILAVIAEGTELPGHVLISGGDGAAFSGGDRLTWMEAEGR